jgi:hypothetical protein
MLWQKLPYLYLCSGLTFGDMFFDKYFQPAKVGLQPDRWKNGPSGP